MFLEPCENSHEKEKFKRERKKELQVEPGKEYKSVSLGLRIGFPDMDDYHSWHKNLNMCPTRNAFETILCQDVLREFKSYEKGSGEVLTLTCKPGSSEEQKNPADRLTGLHKSPCCHLMFLHGKSRLTAHCKRTEQG